jgi:hypothetical protein
MFDSVIPVNTGIQIEIIQIDIDSCFRRMTLKM